RKQGRIRVGVEDAVDDRLLGRVERARARIDRRNVELFADILFQIAEVATKGQLRSVRIAQRVGDASSGGEQVAIGRTVEQDVIGHAGAGQRWAVFQGRLDAIHDLALRGV